ncbi:MAG TPA: hypothetical protein VHM89_06405 [Acidimicrobiales bacterium]|nr:hypothetical protein [Acidimicrobiales bacterium]
MTTRPTPPPEGTVNDDRASTVLSVFASRCGNIRPKHRCTAATSRGSSWCMRTIDAGDKRNTTLGRSQGRRQAAGGQEVDVAGRVALANEAE